MDIHLQVLGKQGVQHISEVIETGTGLSFMEDNDLDLKQRRYEEEPFP